MSTSDLILIFSLISHFIRKFTSFLLSLNYQSPYLLSNVDKTSGETARDQIGKSWNSINKLRMLFTSPPSSAIPSAWDWNILESSTGSLVWSNSPTPVSMYLLSTNEMNSFCLSFIIVNIVASAAETRSALYFICQLTPVKPSKSSKDLRL